MQPDILFWDVGGLYFILGISVKGTAFLAANMPRNQELDEETVMDILAKAPDDMMVGVPEDQNIMSHPLH